MKIIATFYLSIRLGCVQMIFGFTNPATTKIDEDLELRYPHKGMFKELLKNEVFQKSIIRDCCS
ncbi:unnamed protein product [Trifolium pratense]|uniref:Uncharacterized protein n=1 Tax=Trifolium pratense TaxID=57577 RepID=A0ACB0IK29_TRIPR|nr:unnamed protein product [Trifolium pratense]